MAGKGELCESCYIFDVEGDYTCVGCGIPVCNDCHYEYAFLCKDCDKQNKEIFGE